ncbi:efflux RND transporter periplasmic adaptor subunit [Stenotrophomonas sp.]|jgi:multidrug efflux system membrane fusion protein|nr:efflux RND transporter periplasmic adaptor subunit [Stenotrophomonas sp.]
MISAGDPARVLQMKTNRICAAACAAIMAVTTACSREDVPAVAAPAVTVATLSPSIVQLDDELPGRVAAVRTAQIRAQVGGIVLKRLFEQGAEVKAGTPLFQIDPAAFHAEVDSAAAMLQRSEATLARTRVQSERLQSLAAAQVVSHQARDDARAEHQQALADVAQARATLARRRLDLRYATVDAPIDGRIDQALVTEGALVTASDATPMAVVQELDQVYVDVRQPASMLESIQRSVVSGQLDKATGLPVTLLGSGGQAYPEKGRILFSGINVDAETGDIVLRIVVDNPERRLLPGMFVRARVPRGVQPAALLLPQQAVLRSTGGQAYAWVIGKDGKAVIRTVEIDGQVERQYVVKHGLHAGERVVVEGQERLQEGVVVDARPWKHPQTTGALGAP